MTDEAAMQLALAAARQGIGLTSPNPPVGAVIVGDDDSVLGTGWHHRAGGPHAEIEALTNAAKAGYNIAGATIYVTLEPCSTHGRTPPCVDALIAAKLGRVVWGAEDPNPAHLGRAEELLNKAGISVTTGVCHVECGEILRPFSKLIRTGLPWVIAKAGMSLDGKITRPAGEGQWITSVESREDAMHLRVRADAILVGAGTVRLDNPSLTLRESSVPEGKLQPWRVILTGSAELPSGSQVFTDAHKDRTLVFQNKSLDEILRDLGSKGVMTVLIEGGGKILAAAFAGDHVDEVVFYMAPLISGSGVSVVNPLTFEGGSIPLEFQEIRRIGSDLRLSALVRKKSYP